MTYLEVGMAGYNAMPEETAVEPTIGQVTTALTFQVTAGMAELRAVLSTLAQSAVQHLRE